MNASRLLLLLFLAVATVISEEAIATQNESKPSPENAKQTPVEEKSENSQPATSDGQPPSNQDTGVTSGSEAVQEKEQASPENQAQVQDLGQGKEGQDQNLEAQKKDLEPDLKTGGGGQEVATTELEVVDQPPQPTSPSSKEEEQELEKPEDSDTQEEIHKTDSFLLQIQLGLLLITILTGHYLRTHKIVRIRETGLAILYGLIAGGFIIVIFGLHGIEDKHSNYILQPGKCPNNNITTAERNIILQIKNNYYGYKLLDAVTPATATILFELEKISFDPEIFFHLLLPPIIFYAAYSMRKRHFFRNISTILTFAFIGTLVSTFVTAIIVYFFVMIAKTFGDLKSFYFNDCLYFGAIISATDPVTVLAVFKEKSVDVDLDAILFGESILNDAVAIVLAGAIKANSETGGDGEDDGSTHPMGVILSFFGVFFGSFFIGSIIAVLNSLFFKWMPFVTEPIMETAIFVMASWSAFLTAESLGCSGIVAVLFAGILQAQYTYRNLSTLGQTLSKELFHLLAFVSENFVFCYMGLTITQAAKQTWSFWFILGSFTGIIVGRAANIYPLSWILNKFNRSGKKIPMSFQHMMMWSGLRGAMAFALAIRDTITSKEQIIFTTTLMICYLTVWVLGSGSSIALERLRIQVGVDPDADLQTQGSYQNHNVIFKLWHRIDKGYLRPFLTSNLYGEDCSPVLSPGETRNNSTSLSYNQAHSRIQDFRRNSSSNFSSINEANTIGLEMNQTAMNIAEQMQNRQNVNMVRNGQSVETARGFDDDEIILHDGMSRSENADRKGFEVTFE